MSGFPMGSWIHDGLSGFTLGSGVHDGFLEAGRFLASRWVKSNSQMDLDPNI